jgi:hypothetical protein
VSILATVRTFPERSLDAEEVLPESNGGMTTKLYTKPSTYKLWVVLPISAMITECTRAVRNTKNLTALEKNAQVKATIKATEYLKAW